MEHHDCEHDQYHELIGPKVNLITENHPADPVDRRSLICKPIVIKRNAWIGAAATILPGVTIGANAIVAARAVVSKVFLQIQLLVACREKLLKQLVNHKPLNK